MGESYGGSLLVEFGLGLGCLDLNVFVANLFAFDDFLLSLIEFLYVFR